MNIRKKIRHQWYAPMCLINPSKEQGTGFWFEHNGQKYFQELYQNNMGE